MVQMISSVSGRYLGKRLFNCFYIAHTHALRGVDVPFGGYDLLLFYTFNFVAIVDFR